MSVLVPMAVLLAATVTAVEPVADTRFVQPYHAPFAVGDTAAANDVRSIAGDVHGTVWAATRAGVYRLNPAAGKWRPLLQGADVGPAFAVLADPTGPLWFGAWNGLYRSTPEGLEKVVGVDQPITALGMDVDSIVALGPDGLWRVRGTQAVHHPLPCGQSVRAVVSDGKGGLWIATAVGLYHHTSASSTCYRDQDHVLSADIRDVTRDPDGTIWVAALGGATVLDAEHRATHHTPTEGLPSTDARSVVCAPDGTIWVGTGCGVARYDGQAWAVRHSRRWLLKDEVRDVWIDVQGTAWIATGGGVSAIRHQRTTLDAKADYYLSQCHARHVRAPGLVGICRLAVPGDTSSWQPQDDDNDGQYTSLYLAMQAFRYAVTNDPRAKARAKTAFDALRFLQTVTGTPSFVARTVVPSSWTAMHDPNQALTDRQWVDRRVRDPRDKRVPIRWHRTPDDNWLWKGDTSSDEITGHFYGYLWYYDLVADAAERDRVRAHVCRIMDGIINDGFVLKDVDGSHTRWGVWAPERLNNDPNWAPERPINSLEILSFLTVAYHMSGDDKYQRHYRRLVEQHGYAENVRRAKTLVPSWRTHISDELLALAYPALLKYEQNRKLREIYRQSLDDWYRTAKEDHSPLFNFTYGSLAGSDFDLPNSIAFLRDAPLDLIHWRVDNTLRADIQLTQFPELGTIQTARLLPPSEQAVIRWDKNPWAAVRGDGGHGESDGVYWLLPYWMGRYYGFIAPPESDSQSDD